MEGEIQKFTEEVWAYYAKHARDLPWRRPEPDGSFAPYKILVSEVMLQQTQVSRVSPKYQTFLQRFPDVQTLASAPLGDVLRAWQGLGYNRRAKYLWQAAQKIMQDYDGVFPTAIDALVTLPGVGRNTAGAICCYAFNRPEPFIETNIRTVYIHHFFPDGEQVSDAKLMPLIERTLDKETPREWHWALMDYGTHLKSKVGNASRQSKYHVKQSTFEGSKRQLRGWVLRELTQKDRSLTSLKKANDDPRLTAVLADLTNEGLICKTKSLYSLA